MVQKQCRLSGNRIFGSEMDGKCQYKYLYDERRIEPAGCHMDNNKHLIIRFVEELWNQRKLAVADDIFDSDCRTFQLRSGAPVTSEPRGPQVIKTHISEWLSGFPDLHFTIEQMIAEGDRVSSLLVMEGTHTGQWLGIPPTGKRITIRMMTIHRIQRGKIIEDWVIVESLGFFQQLGILPETSDLLLEFREKKGSLT
jgi:predicted ester cyclase